VAWTALVRSHSVEKDDRVLEALKVGQVSRIYREVQVLAVDGAIFCCWG
jgi:hypothetical protein